MSRTFEVSFRSIGLTSMLGLVMLSACERDRNRSAVLDSALNRDLTLASQPAPRPMSLGGLGDTATNASSGRAKATKNGPTPATAPNSAPPTALHAAPRTPGRGSVRTPAPAPTKLGAPAPVAKVAPTTAVTSAPADSGTTAASANAAGAAAGSPAPAPRVIAAGTVLLAQTTAQVCSLANKPGDKFVATLAQDIVGPDGARIPSGSPVLLEMASPEPPAEFAFRVKGVQIDGRLFPLYGQVAADGATTDHRVSKGGDKTKVLSGAVTGAILGRILGGGSAKGAVIGAAGGAAAGTIQAVRNSTVEHCLPSGAKLTVTLTNPLVLTSTTP